MTTGIAYGAKMNSRERLDRRVTSVSSTSAAAIATISCAGIMTIANAATRRSPSRKSGSVNAFT